MKADQLRELTEIALKTINLHLEEYGLSWHYFNQLEVVPLIWTD